MTAQEENRPETVCRTCKRPLDQVNDPLSTDCGGDCWGCVGADEAEGGFGPSVIRYNDEVDAGFRKGPKLTIKDD